MTAAAHKPAVPIAAYLAPGRFVDSHHPAVQAFAHAHADAAMTPRDIGVKLYYAVRDGFRYDPYHFDMSEVMYGWLRSFCRSRWFLPSG